MKRRPIIVGILGLAGSVSSRAQAPRAPGRIGYLHPRTIASDHPTLAVLRPIWSGLGYVDGESVLLRSAEGDPHRLAPLVAELIALKAGVLIVVGAEAVRAASRLTNSTPIVAIDFETDPVRAGYAASVGRPGGNVTGLFVDQPSLAGKWIDLLREAVPVIERVALLWDPSTGLDQLRIAQSVARAKGLESSVIELRVATRFDEALGGLVNRQRLGVVHLTSPGFSVLAADFATAAQKYRLPTISHLKIYARSGVLLTCGTVQEVYYPRAVLFADKILRGASPGELPIEGPDRFELTINLKTAKALGLTIPQSLLLRADEVIE